MTVTAMPVSARRRPLRRINPADRGLGPIGWILLIIVGAFGVLPLYWLVITAFSTTRDAFAPGFRLIPPSLTLQNLEAFFTDADLLGYLTNSVAVSVLTAVLSVIVAGYTAYSFSKFRYRGRVTLMSTILVGQMLPQSVLLITLYLMMQQLGLLNSYWSLVLSYTTFTLPLCVLTLKGFFDAIPDELIEAAKVDRAGQLTIIHRILLPVLAPGLVASGLFAFVRSWNDFIIALTLTTGEHQTLPPGLTRAYINEAGANWPGLMAASLVVSLPVVLCFIALQRYLVAGLASGAVKG